jgi:hypothetical protein
MATTVTTTTVTTANAIGMANAFGLLLILTLVVLLISKDVVVGAPGGSYSRWNAALWVGVVPLTVSFVIIVAINLAHVNS